MSTETPNPCSDQRAVCLAADAILEQCAKYIDCVDDDQYVRVSEVVPGGTVGKHIRHILDHFRCAITTDCTEPIDYDHRKRGGSVEEDRDAAKGEISTLRTLMAGLGVEDLGETVTTRVMLCGDGQTADLSSTRAREIFFAMHHAIHHNAILKAIGLELGLDCPEGFGTAPSTINFEQAEAK
ncbi:MAG: DinB family protein [bacterium]|nr:DinB family protein [bacterium]